MSYPTECQSGLGMLTFHIVLLRHKMLWEEVTIKKLMSKCRRPSGRGRGSLHGLRTRFSHQILNISDGLHSYQRYLKGLNSCQNRSTSNNHKTPTTNAYMMQSYSKAVFRVQWFHDLCPMSMSKRKGVHIGAFYGWSLRLNVVVLCVHLICAFLFVHVCVEDNE